MDYNGLDDIKAKLQDQINGMVRTPIDRASTGQKTASEGGYEMYEEMRKLYERFAQQQQYVSEYDSATARNLPPEVIKRITDWKEGKKVKPAETKKDPLQEAIDKAVREIKG
jgi:hypothetical protein